MFCLPSDHFLPNKFPCNDWKFCTEETLKYCWERVKVVKFVVLEKNPLVTVFINVTPPASCDSVLGQTAQNRGLGLRCTQPWSHLAAVGAVEYKSLLWQHSVVVGLIYMTKKY